MTDVYQAPEAELTEFTNVDGYGSVERAVLGEYEFNISDIFNEAWGKIKGNKGRFWLCLIVYYIVVMVMNAVNFLPPLLGVQDPMLAGLLSAATQILYIAITLPLGMGAGFIGIRIAMGAPFSPGSLFVFYPKTLKMFFTYVLMALTVILAFLLFVIPGIYLMMGYAFALFLVADKELGIWEAMEVSRKAVTKRWFAIFGFGLLLWLIIVAGMMMLFVGLIWAAPFAAVAWGIAYRNIFGVEAETLARQ